VGKQPRTPQRRRNVSRPGQLTEVRDVRRRFGFLGMATSIALAATVVLAAPAEARRNVGGLVGEACLTSGQAAVKTEGPGLGATCVCITQTFDDRTVVVAGPNDTCPSGILRLQGHR
jgi:hypothetical protein